MVLARAVEAAAHPVERPELYVSHCIVRDPRSSQHGQHQTRPCEAELRVRDRRVGRVYDTFSQSKWSVQAEGEDEVEGAYTAERQLQGMTERELE